ncbi:MAG TPA: SPOR domain-containing protein [Bacteroidia bacterium]|nr:SPOR domain-containing protein [Bacteroidia bacterium]
MAIQKVDKQISELLYEYDCVIVPNFGGFVSNYTPAKIHPAHHTFQPPSKSVVFNKNLKHNDGLLANHVASGFNTDYAGALKQIDQFVNHANSQFKAGKKVLIEDVGTLYWDVERNIQFEPSTKNYLLDAFGLVQFQSPAIKRDAIGKRIEKQLKDREPVVLPVNRRKTIKRLVALTIAVPIIAALIWIPYKTELFKNTNNANLNPFHSTESNKTIVNEQPVETDLQPAYKDSTRTKTLSENSSQPVTATMVTPVKADTTSVVIENDKTINFKFHVVAGCFQIESNAINYIAKLQQQNIQASIIGQNENGLYIVSCGDFRSRKEATTKLNDLRNQQQSVWLYKN